MKFFVTGGTGFIGGEVVRQLTAAGHECSLLVRRPERAQAQFKGNPLVALHQGDVTDRESIRPAMEGCDGVFHLAAWVEVNASGRSKEARAINVEGTRNVLQLMQELGIKKGVYTSSLAVNSDTRGVLVDESYEFKGKHLMLYDQTKWEAHYEVALPLMRSGLPLVIVMPGVVYGPGDTGPIHDIFSDYLRRRMPAVPRGTTKSFAHVEDVARAHIQAMERGTPGESYIVAGPVAVITDMLSLCEKLCGVKAPRVKLSPVVLKTAAALLTPLSYLVPLPSTIQPGVLRSIAGTTYIASNDKAKRELGYNPRSMEEGFREMLAYEVQFLDVKKRKKYGVKEDIGFP